MTAPGHRLSGHRKRRMPQGSLLMTSQAFGEIHSRSRKDGDEHQMNRSGAMLAIGAGLYLQLSGFGKLSSFADGTLRWMPRSRLTFF